MAGIWRIVIITLTLAILAGMVVLITHPYKTISISITPGSDIHINKAGIYGAVKTPGIYEFEGEIRVDDAVGLAGGYTEDADVAHSNPSHWVGDGETIFIPTAGLPEATLTLPVLDEEKVNLNTADKNELMKLPGIGEKRAEEIIRLRNEKGKFQSREEILEISGISQKLLESIYDRLIIQ